jgi:hypothetical protein
MRNHAANLVLRSGTVAGRFINHRLHQERAGWMPTPARVELNHFTSRHISDLRVTSRGNPLESPAAMVQPSRQVSATPDPQVRVDTWPAEPRFLVQPSLVDGCASVDVSDRRASSTQPSTSQTATLGSDDHASYEDRSDSRHYGIRCSGDDATFLWREPAKWISYVTC